MIATSTSQSRHSVYDDCTELTGGCEQFAAVFVNDLGASRDDFSSFEREQSRPGPNADMRACNCVYWSESSRHVYSIVFQ